MLSQGRRSKVSVPVSACEYEVCVLKPKSLFSWALSHIAKASSVFCSDESETRTRHYLVFRERLVAVALKMLSSKTGKRASLQVLHHRALLREAQAAPRAHPFLAAILPRL